MAWLSQRVDFNVREFYRIIEQQGYLMTWEKASICPCLSKNSNGQPDFNCPLCKGKGRYWYDDKTIKGIMSNLNSQPKYNQIGEVLAGTSSFTTISQNKLGLWDRLTHKHSEMRYSEIIAKGEYGKKDNLRFPPIEILNIRTVSTLYVSGLDYMIDTETESLSWLPSGKEPNTGEQYTIEYITHPRWIVIDLTNVIRDVYVKSKRPGIAHVQMPLRAMVCLEYFVL